MLRLEKYVKYKGGTTYAKYLIAVLEAMATLSNCPAS